MSEEESLQGMTGPGDEPEADPFGEVEEPDEENLISDAMVKKATYHIHKLAEQRKQDYKKIQKKCKEVFNYTNLAKVSMDKGHEIINDLVKRTGGEEEPRLATDDDPQLPIKSDAEQPKKEIKKEPADRSETIYSQELEKELLKLAGMLQICVGFSRDIVQEEISKESITEGTKATLIKSFAATLFIEASRRGLGR